MNSFVSTLRYIRINNGRFPDTVKSIQDRNEIGDSGVPDEFIRAKHIEFVEERLGWSKDTDILVGLVDGFLLYSDQAVIDELDIRLFVRAPYERLKVRREGRAGYATLEGTPDVLCGG